MVFSLLSNFKSDNCLFVAVGSSSGALAVDIPWTVGVALLVSILAIAV